MAINFPTGATPSQIYSYSGLTWIYTGTYWKVYPQLSDVLPLTGGTFDKITETLSLNNAINNPIVVTGFSDYYITGFSYSNNTLSVTQTNNNTLNTTINTFTGLTINGNLNVTGTTKTGVLSATTYQNLPKDVFVTGGTFSGGVMTFVNNTGGTFNISGISSFDTFVTGGTASGSTIVFTNNSGGTFTVTGISSTDTFVTGGTYSSGTATFTNNSGGTFSVTGFSTSTGGTFTGGTVSGATQFLNGVTADTILISGSGQNILTVVGSGSTSPIFTVQGSSGELFSVTDSLIGSLFSVNDISGLPIFEVFSDNTITMGSYIAPSLNTTTKVSAGIGTTNIYSIPTSAYTGAFFDYTVSDGTNLRAGNIMSIWSGTSVNITETSTTSFGTTTGITFNMTVSGGNAILSTSGATSGWTVKTIVRSI